MTLLERLTWKELASLEVGGAVCLPVIMVGHALGFTYGLKAAVLAIFMGNALLLLLALVHAKMSLENRLATADNASLYLGSVSSKAFAAILLIAKGIWFAIQLDMIVLSLEAVAKGAFNPLFARLLLGGAMIAIALCGIRALSRLSTLAMPLLIATMVAAAYFASGSEPVLLTKNLSAGGISLVLAAAITAVIDMPTYFRHSRSLNDSALATVVLFISIALVEGLGVYLCSRHPSSTIVATLQQAHFPLWNLWIALFFTLAGWTTCNTNLYSATACLKTLVPKIKESSCLLILGTVGTTLSFFPILNHFSTVLQLLGTSVSGMGCVIIVAYLAHKKTFKLKTSSLHIAWAAGVALGFASVFEAISLTGIPLIDAFLGTLATLIFYLLYQSRRPLYENSLAR